MSGFNMKIGKIEHYSVREVSEATVVDDQSFTGVNHLHEELDLLFIAKGTGIQRNIVNTLM